MPTPIDSVTLTPKRLSLSSPITVDIVAGDNRCTVPYSSLKTAVLSFEKTSPSDTNGATLGKIPDPAPVPAPTPAVVATPAAPNA